MTIDLFAASVICRDAELAEIVELTSRRAIIPKGWMEAWVGLRAALVGMIRRSFPA